MIWRYWGAGIQVCTICTPRAYDGNYSTPFFERTLFCPTLTPSCGKSPLKCRTARIAAKSRSYIPELARVDPQNFGLAVVGADGHNGGGGDCDTPFSIQSISKVFTLTLALGMVGDRLWQRVGREPSGNPFNSIIQLELENGTPRNPFINAGAIAVTDVILAGRPPRDALAEILRFAASSARMTRSTSTRASRNRRRKPAFAISRWPISCAPSA